MAPRQPRILNNRWQIQERLNGGGQGEVYLVKDKETSQLYAAKVFRLKGYETKKLARAKTEIQAIRKLDGSTNIIQIYDENISDASSAPIELFYIMDRARYGSLADNDFYIGDIEQCLRIFKEILIGVREAHSKGVIHRDLKPANILLYPTQRDVVVTDFGLGLIKDREEDQGVTEVDELLGPRHFMAPEQHRAPSEANERSDIYSLGKILYFMLTGKGKVYREKLDDISEEDNRGNPYLPQIQVKLLNRMVAETPEDRFNDVSEIIDEVGKIIGQLDSNSRRYIKTTEQTGFDVYSVLVGGRRDEFIHYFGRNLSASLRAFEMASRVLIRDGKHHTFASLKEDLLNRYKTGRTRAAINALLAFISSPKDLDAMLPASRYSFPNYYMARYYLQSVSFETAHSYIAQALEMEKDSSLKLDYLLIFDEISRRCSCNQPHDYDKRIRLLIREATESQKAALLNTLGSYYIESGDKKKGLRFLEAFLEWRPYEHAARWKCAFEYAQLNETTLAIHHYLIYLAHNPKSPDAMNNLGVAYHDKQMPIASLEMYRKAYELGNTLAGSNIADLYMKAGMVDDAKKLLNEIVASSYPQPYHDNVATHLGGIVRMKKQEEDGLDKIRGQGSAVSRCSVQSVKSLINNSELSWVGKWKFDEGEFQCTIKQDSIKVIASSTFFKFEGQVDSCCLEVSYCKKEYSIHEYTSGILYLTDEHSFAGYIVESSGVYKMVQGTRVSE